jgi:hypothetical protein
LTKSSPHLKLATSQFKPPSKVKGVLATTSKSQKKRKVKKYNFNKLRTSGMTCYFGPQPKVGAPGTLPDKPFGVPDNKMVIWHQRFLFRGSFQNFQILQGLKSKKNLTGALFKTRDNCRS